VQTPEQTADDAITTLLDNALGARDRDTDDALRAGIWQLIRDAQIQNAREQEEDY
jgi:hypothetical protein